MASYIALHSLSSPITTEDNRWIVTVILIAFSLPVSRRLGEETAGEERKKERPPAHLSLSLFSPKILFQTFIRLVLARQIWLHQ